jgi:hypothetical protein
MFFTDGFGAGSDMAQCRYGKQRERGSPGLMAVMPRKCGLLFVAALTACSGMTGMEPRGMSDGELKARFAAIEREQATYHAGEADAATLKRFQKLSEEESRVERELLRRCRAGDQDACLPRFNMRRQ